MFVFSNTNNNLLGIPNKLVYCPKKHSQRFYKMIPHNKILICDDNPLFHTHLRYSLKDKFDCVSTYNGDEAIATLRSQSIDIVLLDIKMRSHDEGLCYIP